MPQINGGERGIRTLEGLLALTPLAGVRLRPLGHLSVMRTSGYADVILLAERENRDARMRARLRERQRAAAIFAATGERSCRSAVHAVFLRFVRA